MNESKNYYCYIVFNSNNNTYNGYTVNTVRRLRQHNGFLKGGARATHNRGPWEFLIILTSSEWNCISTAMQHEWSIKYPTRKRPRPKEFNGPLGRIQSLYKVFEHMKTKCCFDDIDENKQLYCYIHQNFYDNLLEITKDFSFIKVRLLDDFINLDI